MKSTATLPALLALEDGSVFWGKSIGADDQVTGEVVFNTAMTGYQEILSDPSYARQIVTLTYPHIGNTGINQEDQESDGVYLAGLVIRDLPPHFSNWRARQGLGTFLREQGTVGIAGIDTRRLTRILRDKGAQNGTIMTGNACDEARAIETARAFPGIGGMDLAKEVSTDHAYEWEYGTWNTAALSGFGKVARDACPWHVVAYDFGVKHNILRLLVSHGCRVTVVPAQTSVREVLEYRPNGVFLSNGPGDPAPCEYAISAIRTLLDAELPLFGICLGHQLLALANGAKTVKMKFGHHGANHPVQDLDTGRVLITSQNHGFAVDENTLAPNVRITHKSLFDGSLQGICFTDRPAFGFQGHPEASPGPQDVQPLFERFVRSMANHKNRSH
uniref:Carbamoyl phosphate synthase small chain n=1 Tax=Candidatus Kentrum sp. FM TaxID=2126340 RepID=A0A450TXB7_9GAMM|nr:MAG: carbamoyl-phosphate synthase small subunit [Candidatus Kentron sp. FM]VFJ73930.1 MAG: carbamoyl-phosphate synthase small subunit [Candidatus Kentron sp. FM]VFK21368.1 MAG: carbamoyl-phosphate synthase small subunit [Candidatus Kentron sp. FM]